MKVALVTGGTRGIGKSIVENLCKENYHVAFTYNKSMYLAKKMEKILIDKGYHAMSVKLLLANRKSIKNAIRKIIKKWKNLDVLVNNAAISQEKHFSKINDNDWNNMLINNLRGPFICTQECLPYMISKKWGRIINITSVGGQWGGINQVHYAASKAGLINFTHSMAKIYSKYHITSNAIAVGLVRTDMSKKELNSISGKKKISNIPIGRTGKPDEVAASVVYLANEKSSYITGQTININGGMLFS